jgi:hypothetical protein
VEKKLGWRADTTRPKALTGVHPASVSRLYSIQSVKEGCDDRDGHDGDIRSFSKGVFARILTLALTKLQE